MACCLFGAQPLPVPMMTNYQLEPLEHWNFNKSTKVILRTWKNENVLCKMSAILLRPLGVNCPAVIIWNMLNEDGMTWPSTSPGWLEFCKSEAQAAHNSCHVTQDDFDLCQQLLGSVARSGWDLHWLQIDLQSFRWPGSRNVTVPYGSNFTIKFDRQAPLIGCWLTHWGRLTEICVGKLTIIGSDNGLAPGWHQAIIWTNVGILLIQTLGTNFSEILIEILTSSFKKMQLKMSSGNWRPFCLGLNVLTHWGLNNGWHNFVENIFKRILMKDSFVFCFKFCWGLFLMVHFDG